MDITPALRATAATFSIVLKNNRYPIGNLCGDPAFCPPAAARYEHHVPEPRSGPEWSFTNTTDESCARQPDGTIVCEPRARWFEWCVNQPAIDAAGRDVVNAEGRIPLCDRPEARGARRSSQPGLGAAYTPLSIGADGVIY